MYGQVPESEGGAALIVDLLRTITLHSFLRNIDRLGTIADKGHIARFTSFMRYTAIQSKLFIFRKDQIHILCSRFSGNRTVQNGLILDLLLCVADCVLYLGSDLVLLYLRPICRSRLIP